MRAYHYTSNSGDGAIHIDEVAAPEPGPGEVRVAVDAVSLNFRDLLMLQAAGRGELDNRIPASDGAGLVDALGAGASRFAVGTRVVMAFNRDWVSGTFRASYGGGEPGGPTADGVLAEHVVVPETALVEIPAHLSFAEAAALPCAAVTAWNGLFVRSGMGPESTLLVQGTGGVSMFGLQFGVAIGTRVIVLSSSDEKLARAKDLGASILINYREREDWDAAVMEATDGQGATHILEVVGEATYERSVRSVAAGGTIVQVGVLSGVNYAPRLRRLSFQNANIAALTVGSVDHLAAVTQFLGEHQIQPILDRTFAFEDAAQAFEHLRSGTHFGKVLVAVR